MSAVRTCPVCGDAFETRPRGPARVYCSGRCRQRTYRRRHAHDWLPRPGDRVACTYNDVTAVVVSASVRITTDDDALVIPLDVFVETWRRRG